MITTKEQIVQYFESCAKDKKDFKIGIEHEKFLFDKKKDYRSSPFKKYENNSLRSNYSIISKC